MFTFVLFVVCVPTIIAANNQQASAIAADKGSKKAWFVGDHRTLVTNVFPIGNNWLGQCNCSRQGAARRLGLFDTMGLKPQMSSQLIKVVSLTRFCSFLCSLWSLNPQ